MKSEDLKAQRHQRQIAWFVLVYGFVVMCGGVFGIWMQGEFWDISTNYLAMADQLLHSEVVESFCLPTIVTSLGGLAIAWVILASKLTEKYSSKRKNLIFMIYAAVYVVAVFVPAKIAGDKMWNKAKEVEQKYNTPRSVGTSPR
jgi:hypothetical protein